MREEIDAWLDLLAVKRPWELSAPKATKKEVLKGIMELVHIKEKEVGGEIMLILKNEEVPLIVRHHKAIRTIKKLTHGKKTK